MLTLAICVSFYANSDGSEMARALLVCFASSFTPVTQDIIQIS